MRWGSGGHTERVKPGCGMDAPKVMRGSIDAMRTWPVRGGTRSVAVDGCRGEVFLRADERRAGVRGAGRGGIGWPIGRQKQAGEGGGAPTAPRRARGGGRRGRSRGLRSKVDEERQRCSMWKGRARSAHAFTWRVRRACDDRGRRPADRREIAVGRGEAGRNRCATSSRTKTSTIPRAVRTSRMGAVGGGGGDATEGRRSRRHRSARSGRDVAPRHPSATCTDGGGVAQRFTAELGEGGAASRIATSAHAREDARDEKTRESGQPGTG